MKKFIGKMQKTVDVEDDRYMLTLGQMVDEGKLSGQAVTKIEHISKGVSYKEFNSIEEANEFYENAESGDLESLGFSNQKFTKKLSSRNPYKFDSEPDEREFRS